MIPGLAFTLSCNQGNKFFNISDFGCCPDGVTPKTSERDQCECHSMHYGKQIQLKSMKNIRRYYKTKTRQV